MSLTLNVVGGGSGGGSGPSASDAILTVTVPTGSTVTATKGNVTLTPTMWVQAADATLACALFVIPAAQFDSTTPWTVTETDGAGSLTDEVVIDSNQRYDLPLYRLYIFREGVGMVNGFTATGRTAPTVSANKIIWSTNVNVGNQMWFSPSIDLSTNHYKTLVFEIKCNGRYSNSYSASFGVGPNLPTGQSAPGTFDAQTSAFYVAERRTYALDISSASGQVEYIKLAAYAVTGEIYNAWLSEGSIP